MNELNLLYSSMWKSWNGEIENNGKLLIRVDNEKFPILIDGMELHMPLSNLIDGNSMDKVFFHPACENITSKETEVFKVIRKVTVMKLLFTFMTYPTVVIPIASRKEKKAWRQDVVDILMPLKTVKKSVINEVTNLFRMMTVENENEGLDCRFLHIKTTKAPGRNRTTGTKVYYIAKPSFPFYNELAKVLARNTGVSDNTEVSAFNTTVSVAALKTIVHLFECCIPGVNNPDDYTTESNDPVAARLAAYLNCYAAIAEDLNRIQNLFREDFDKINMQRIFLDWTEQLETLPDIWRQVPQLDYNSHNSQQESEVSVAQMSNMFDITSTPRNNSNNNGNNNANNNSNQSNFQSNNQDVIIQTQNGEFNVTRPIMAPGDTYINYEIDFGQQRVRHHANSPQGPIVYVCSRAGNFLQKEMPNMMGMGMGMNMGMPMGVMGGVPNMNPLVQQQMMLARMQQMNAGYQNPLANNGQPLNITPTTTGHTPHTW